ncbi:hypothetical protein VNO77_43165 [Canavalia gladiata]|uniref:Uncharacterized protein n=1 Tax=Canavalia gladiata TaxID=3824 RepID=A0AAN9JVZ3_CANGL
MNSFYSFDFVAWTMLAIWFILSFQTRKEHNRCEEQETSLFTCFCSYDMPYSCIHSISETAMHVPCVIKEEPIC